MSFHPAATLDEKPAQRDLGVDWAQLALIDNSSEEIMPIANPLPLHRIAIIGALAVLAWAPFVAIYVAGH
jgi:hypothetical protein